MEEEKIAVHAYSGGRLNERPISFSYKNRVFTIKEILSRSLDESPGVEERRYRFRVSCEGEEIFTISYDFLRDRWFLQKLGKGGRL